MTPALAPETLQSAGVLCVLGIALYTCLYLGTSLPCEAVVTLPAVEELIAKVFWPRPVRLLWELGQTGVFLSILPLPRPLCLGLFGALAGQVPCSALFRAAINWAIWLPSSFEPSDTSVVTDDHAFPFSFASSFSLSAFLAVTISGSMWFQGCHGDTLLSL